MGWFSVGAVAVLFPFPSILKLVPRAEHLELDVNLCARSRRHRVKSTKAGLQTVQTSRLIYVAFRNEDEGAEGHALLG
jgi:hypothetical protein